jgi:hypothetical protein
LGIINEDFIRLMQTQLAPDEYLRQLLCRNVSSRNLIWEGKLREALTAGLAAGITQAAPVPGMRYRKRGLLSFGYDAAGHGESAHASRHALVVTEQISGYGCVIFAKSWAAGADDMAVMRDIIGLWDYFRPDYALGDAYGVGALTVLNDELYRQGLTHIDRRAIGDGQSTASSWPEWAFSPIRFEGMTKHGMFQALRAMFHNGQAALPYIEDYNLEDPETHDLRWLYRQIPNIKAVPNKTSYASYKMADQKLGDDLVDALAASVWGLVTRGAAPFETVVMMRTVGKNSLENHDNKHAGRDCTAVAISLD